jgi:hypothetical protein
LIKIRDERYPITNIAAEISSPQILDRSHRSSVANA